MSKSDPAASKRERNKTIRWVVTIFIVTIFISGAISLLSDVIMENSSVFVAFLILLAIILILVVVLWATSFNQMMLSSVHQALADSRGIKVVWKNFLFTAAIAAVVTITMSWVGLLAINSLLVLPAAAARNLSRNLHQYHLISVLGGLVCGIGGLMVSYYLGASTGASITVLLALWFFLSLLFKAKH